jgi:hypothetical protein
MARHAASLRLGRQKIHRFLARRFNLTDYQAGQRKSRMNSTSFTACAQRGCFLLLIAFCARAEASPSIGGDPLRGKAAIGRYGCVA